MRRTIPEILNEEKFFSEILTWIIVLRIYRETPYFNIRKNDKRNILRIYQESNKMQFGRNSLTNLYTNLGLCRKKSLQQI